MIERHNARWVSSSISVYDMEKLLDSNLGIDEDILKNILIYHCSNCGENNKRTPYCPNCGAKMSWEEEENDTCSI